MLGTHTGPGPGSAGGPPARREAGRPAPGPRSPRVLTHVPAAPAPLAPALAQIRAPVARPCPQRCCCGNSMAMSICQTASLGRAALARWAPGPPGRAEAAASGGRPGQLRASRPARPPPPRHRFMERYQGGKWRLRSPRTPGVITFTHTHTPARTHTRTQARGEPG